MNLDEIWQAAAADNPEAQDYLLQFEREVRPRAVAAMSKIVSELTPSPVPPAETETETKPTYAFEFEVREPVSVIGQLADGLDRRIVLFRMLVPAFTELRPMLVRSLMESAMQLEQDGDLEAAATRIDEAVGHGRQLHGPDWDTTVVHALYERSRISMRLGLAEEALHRLREAADYVNADSELAFACAQLRSGILATICQVLLQGGDRGKVHSYLVEHAGVLRWLAQRDSTELANLATVLSRLGSLVFKDDEAVGRAALSEAIAIRRELAVADPPLHLVGLAIALNNFGHLNQSTGDLEKARLALAEAVSIRRGLAAAEFSSHSAPLLRCLNNLVIVLLDQKPTRAADLLEATAEARALSERLAVLDPDARIDVPLTLVQFAEARVLTDRELDAAKDALDCLLTEYSSEASEDDLLDHATALRQDLS
ncbi:MAG: hypothetical protein ACLPKE_12865 [Streptosporangiaceae bacterium]